MTERKVRSIPVAELQGIESPPYLVKGFLIAKAASVIYGPPKSRKSFVMLDLAAHVALGRPWCGRKVLQGPVFYVVAEGWHSINNRVEAFFQHHGLEREGVPLFVMQPVRLGGKEGKDDAEAIVAEIERQKVEPVLIVLDTLNRTMVGDENSTQDMSAYIRRLDYLRGKTGAHVCVVHHTGKDKDRGSRGSSALQGAVDTECPVDRAEDLTAVGPPIQRDLPEDFRQTFEAKEVEVGLDEDAEPITSLVVLPTDRVPVVEEKLPKASQQALDVLWAEVQGGRGVRGGSGGPPIDDRLHGVREDRWRELCDAIPLTKGASRNAAGNAFHRARGRLLDAKKIGEGDGWVWPWPKDDAGAQDEIPF